MNRKININISLNESEIQTICNALSCNIDITTKETQTPNFSQQLLKKFEKLQKKASFSKKILEKFDNKIPFTNEELYQFHSPRRYNFEEEENIGYMFSRHTYCHSSTYPKYACPKEIFSTVTVCLDGDNKYMQPYRYLQFEVKDIIKENPNRKIGDDFYLYDVEFLSIREVYPTSIQYQKIKERDRIDDRVKEYANIDDNIYHPLTMNKITDTNLLY